MREEAVNARIKKWLMENDYSYKGVCKRGDVPIPSGSLKRLMIDHVGIKLTDREGRAITFLDERFYKSDKRTDNLGFQQLWIEAKGSDANLSELFDGFTKVVYAVYHGGGQGILAVPENEFKMLIEEQREFLEKMSLVVAGRGRVGLLNAENEAELVIF